MPPPYTNTLLTWYNTVAQNNLLHFPDFTHPFDVHTDASNLQLDRVLSQDDESLAYLSWKLNPTQPRYTTTEKELLVITEVLRQFLTISLGW